MTTLPPLLAYKALILLVASFTQVLYEAILWKAFFFWEASALIWSTYIRVVVNNIEWVIFLIKINQTLIMLLLSQKYNKNYYFEMI